MTGSIFSKRNISVEEYSANQVLSSKEYNVLAAQTASNHCIEVTPEQGKKIINEACVLDSVKVAKFVQFQ